MLFKNISAQKRNEVFFLIFVNIPLFLSIGSQEYLFLLALYAASILGFNVGGFVAARPDALARILSSAIAFLILKKRFGVSVNKQRLVLLSFMFVSLGEFCAMKCLQGELEKYFVPAAGLTCLFACFALKLAHLSAFFAVVTPLTVAFYKAKYQHVDILLYFARERILLLIAYWSVCFLVYGGVWLFFVKDSSNVTFNAKRKFFHFLAVQLFVPGVLVDAAFMGMMLLVAAATFVLFEKIRIERQSKIHEAIPIKNPQAYSSQFIFCHFDLLLACALPLWLEMRYALLDGDTPVSPVLLGGIVAVGIGDTAVSSSGVFFACANFELFFFASFRLHFWVENWVFCDFAAMKNRLVVFLLSSSVLLDFIWRFKVF